MRVITRSAEEVRAIRRTLELTQAELAERLQVSRRTIIRGEQRGLEVPWYSTGNINRYELSRLWDLAQKEAADRARAARAPKSHLPREVTLSRSRSRRVSR